MGEARITVRGESGKLYLFAQGRIWQMDGLGAPRASTCWRFDGFHPAQDGLWAMVLALQCDEARVLKEFPWMEEPRNSTFP